MNKKNLLKKSFCIISIIILLVLGIFSYRMYSNKNVWYLNYINYNDLHKYSNGENQTIALIDTGTSKFQDEFISKKFTVVGNGCYDNNGHGTIMASIIKGNNKTLPGIAPNSKLISIKVLDNNGKIRPESIKKALEIAIDYHVDIINISIGSYKTNSEITNLINEAIKKNIIVVSSSGDYADVKLMFPANIDGVISVGAIDKNKKNLKISTAPELTTINAPGKDIMGINYDKNIIYSSGTSQATAIISGYISLLLDVSNKNNKSMSNNEISYYLHRIKENKCNYLDIIKSIGR